MELAFDTRLEITRIAGRIYSRQARPTLSEKPVLTPDGLADGNRVQIGTVLKDGGVYRMWYLAFPEQDAPKAKAFAAYAESDDGLIWRRPRLNLVEGVPFDNNYIDVGVSSVFIDPAASAPRRYGAVGHLRYLRQTWTGAGHNPDPAGTTSSFYTAHSADGLHWEVDPPKPRWYSGDTVHCAFHPGRRCALVGMKFVRRVNGIQRRAIWTAERRDGEWSDPVCALAPDEFDDVAAAARGFNSADYYDMAFLGAGDGTAGLLCSFRHTLPLSPTPENYAIFGTSDISLVFQPHSGDRWLHAPGRKSFISSGETSWNQGWTGLSSGPVENGDEHWLYLTGHRFDHAWDMDADWNVMGKWREVREAAGCHSVIGLARWPKWRLFGLLADPEGQVDIELGPIDKPSELSLNYCAGFRGSVRVQFHTREMRGDCGDVTGRSDIADCLPLTGDSISELVRWREGSVIGPTTSRQTVARITLENATLYGWELRPAP